MEKPAITKYNIHQLLEKRWSPRAFNNTPVENEKIQKIIEAGRWAPSSFNEQPWRFIIGKKGTKTWDMIYDTLIEFNQAWAKNADVLFIAIGSKILSSNNKPNAVYHYDVGQSVAYMTFQATSEGLHMHQMGGFSKEKATSLFNIPEDFEPLTAFAIGYMGEIDMLEDSFLKMEKTPRQRKSLNEIAFEGSFGNSLSFI